MGAEIGIGALLGAAGISALGNLGGAAISASGANSSNAALMAFNREEAAKNRQFQREMYQQQLTDQEMMYNKYQSPEAIARQLQNIGVNAAGVFGSGKSGFSGSLPSVPSVPSGSQASVGSLVNPMADYAQALKGSTSDAVSVLNAMTDKQLKDKQGLKILAEKANLQTQNEILQWQNMINQTVGSEKAKEELNHIIVQTATLATAGELNKAQTLVAETIQKLHQKEFEIKDEELWQLQTRGLFLVQSLKNEQDLQREVIKTEKSKRASNYANANLSNEQALTVKELRGWQAGFEQARTEIMQTESFVKRNTLWEQCESYLAELRAKKMLPEQVEQAIRKAKKENDWYEINELLGVVDTGTKVAGTYYGAKTGQGFVSAQNTRNEIQSQYNQYLYNKDNEAYKARRTAVAGSGHYWGQEY